MGPGTITRLSQRELIFKTPLRDYLITTALTTLVPYMKESSKVQ